MWKLKIYFLVEKIIIFLLILSSCGHFQLSCSYIIAHRDVQLLLTKTKNIKKKIISTSVSARTSFK